MNRMVRSFKDAFAGLNYCFRTQPNMVIHLGIGILVIGLSLVLRLCLLELLLLVTAVFGVLAAEAFNTALERTVDLVTREQNELAHLAKDAAAGAVLLAAIYALVVGGGILGTRLWKLVKF